jgi:predicted deacetylase
MSRAVAVAIHDVEPATFERCALIRDWLRDLGVDRATLLVVPASDLHPVADRSPELVAWLAECAHEGDAIAQQGLRAAPSEFVGLDARDTRRAVAAGRRVLRLAGLEPRGFVAPAYAYTGALVETVSATFDWWAGLARVYVGARPRRSTLAPALAFGTQGRARRAISPWLVRAGARAGGDLLRLDLHPADLDHRRNVGATEAVLRTGPRRRAVTYDDLV